MPGSIKNRKRDAQGRFVSTKSSKSKKSNKSKKSSKSHKSKKVSLLWAKPIKKNFNFGMFTKEGNEKIAEIINHSTGRKAYILNELKKLGKTKKFSEATDSAVADSIWRYLDWY